jgi:hypothetical protein
VRHQAAWFFAVPVGALLVLAAHLAAHAVAVNVAGGRVIGIDWAPGPEIFILGSLKFETLPPARIPTVATAPMLLLAVWIGAGSVLSALSESRTFAKFAWLVGFALPMIDLSLSAGGLFLQQSRSDWYRAFHGAEINVALLCGVGAAWFGEVGERMFRRAFGDALSPSESMLLYLALIALPWLRYGV